MTLFFSLRSFFNKNAHIFSAKICNQNITGRLTTTERVKKRERASKRAEHLNVCKYSEFCYENVKIVKMVNGWNAKAYVYDITIILAPIFKQIKSAYKLCIKMLLMRNV